MEGGMLPAWDVAGVIGRELGIKESIGSTCTKSGGTIMRLGVHKRVGIVVEAFYASLVA